jgi:hypothetical protein
MLYREIIAVCSQNHTKHINTLCGQNAKFLNVKPCGTYSNHWAWKDYMTELIYWTWALSNSMTYRPTSNFITAPHYSTSWVPNALLLMPRSTASFHRPRVHRLANKFRSMFCVPTTPVLCTDPDQSNQTLPFIFYRSILILYYLLLCLPSGLISSYCPI